MFEQQHKTKYWVQLFLSVFVRCIQRRSPTACLFNTTILDTSLALPRSITSQGLVTALVCMQTDVWPSTAAALALAPG